MKDFEKMVGDIMQDLGGIFAGRHLQRVRARIAIGLREAYADGLRDGLERAVKELAPTGNEGSLMRDAAARIRAEADRIEGEGSSGAT